VQKNTEIPRRFADYAVKIDDTAMPTGVVVSKLF